MAKTYCGKTAGGWLRSARVGLSAAGIAEIWVRVGSREVLAMRGAPYAGADREDSLLLGEPEGQLARLETSTRAYNRLRTLEADCDRMSAEVAR